MITVGRVAGIVALCSLAFAYGLFDRAVDPAATVGLWNVVLDVALGRQFLAYVVSPLWLAATWFACERATLLPHLVRYGSRLGTLAAIVRQLWPVFGAGVPAVLVGAAASSIGLAIPAIPIEGSTAETYSELGLPPVLGLACRILLVGAFLGATSACLACLHLVINSWAVTIIVGGLLFAWLAVSANGWIEGWADLASALDPARLVRGAFAFSLAVVVVASALGVALTRLVDRRSTR